MYQSPPEGRYACGAHVLQSWPRGFGVGDGQWIQGFDQYVMNIFENN